jgi:hypothetical protein
MQSMNDRFSGYWRITEMAVWSKDAIDLVGPAHIIFDDEDGMGRFRFIAVTGFTDCRYSERNGNPLVEFSWQGSDEGDEAYGRGWAIIESDGKLRGHIFIHCGEDSSFVAEQG